MCDHEGKNCWSGCNCPCMSCMFGDEEEEIEEEEEDLDFFTEGDNEPDEFPAFIRGGIVDV